MKKSISLIAFIVLAIYSGFATVRTVSNHPLGGSQFSSLQIAFNASANGDTLMLEGTDDPYFLSSCYWNKSLTVIGIGFNPNKQIPKRSKMRAHCWTWMPIATEGSGSKFYGIEFTHSVAAYGGTISNLVFENCKFNIDLGFSDVVTNYVIRNCIFDKDNGVNFEYGIAGPCNGSITNCVFDGYIAGYNSNTSSVSIDHCVFLGASGHFLNVHYAQIRNSIFMNSFPGSTINSTYTNNLCNIAGSFPPSPANGNTGTGNFENTNPLFVNVPLSTFYAITHDYHFQAGSPSISSGDDGTDLGVQGGYSGFSESGEVLINPIVREMNIMNTSVAPNGTLSVQVHITKPDNE